MPFTASSAFKSFSHTGALTAFCLLLAAFYLFRSVHVRAQGFGNHDRAVRLLVIFQDGNPRASDGETGAVERVYVFGFRAARATKTYLGAARLKRFVVRAGRDFAESVLAGKPDFYVLSLGVAEP